MDHVRYFSKKLFTLINEALMHDLRLADATFISVTTMLGSEKRVAIDLSNENFQDVYNKGHKADYIYGADKWSFQRSRVSCPRIVCV